MIKSAWPFDSNDLPSGEESEEVAENSSPVIDIGEDEMLDVDADIASALAAIESSKSEGPVKPRQETTEPGPAAGETPTESDTPVEEDTRSEASRKMIKQLHKRIKKLRKETSSYRTRLEESNEKAKSLHDSWVRVNADYQNYQKRTRSRMSEFVEAEQMNLIRTFLPVFENFKRALNCSSDSGNFKEGIKLIYKQIEDLLISWKVREIPALGEEFDPFVHDAMDRIPAEKSEDNNIVVRVYETGYFFKERVLRPAKVIVAVSPETQKTIVSESEEAGPLVDRHPGEDIPDQPSGPDESADTVDSMQDVDDPEGNERVNPDEIFTPNEENGKTLDSKDGSDIILEN
ncbi:nucleotide exchange factor GrpE [bacterium]|nr:nucleotide exchange factor GrpE [candidate division CSSED10-310 bacterium]